MISTTNDINSQLVSLANSNKVLLTIRSVFPFQIFPDLYVIQEKTVSIVKRGFFYLGWIETIPIKDIGSIRMYTGPFFSSITLVKKILPQGSIQLSNLWKREALKAKEIIDALIIEQNKLINLPKRISLEAKKEVLTELGKEDKVEKAI